jgi:hypothetical protein
MNFERNGLWGSGTDSLKSKKGLTSGSCGRRDNVSSASIEEGELSWRMAFSGMLRRVTECVDC